MSCSFFTHHTRAMIFFSTPSLLLLQLLTLITRCGFTNNFAHYGHTALFRALITEIANRKPQSIVTREAVETVTNVVQSHKHAPVPRHDNPRDSGNEWRMRGWDCGENHKRDWMFVNTPRLSIVPFNGPLFSLSELPLLLLSDRLWDWQWQWINCWRGRSCEKKRTEEMDKQRNRKERRDLRSTIIRFSIRVFFPFHNSSRT